MNKTILFFSFGILIVLCIACSTQIETYMMCPDNITQVTNITSCPAPKPVCPICNLSNKCVNALCGESTGFKCQYSNINPCDGNGICEEGELGVSNDCPINCDDTNQCTEDSYNFASQSCIHDEKKPCCSNKLCELGETYITCPFDCERILELIMYKIPERRETFSGAEIEDLSGTNKVYLILNFVISNKGIDKLEEINYKQEKGFYYDPYRMKLEDGKGNLYRSEYDSDKLTDWLDVSIIPKGETRRAALLFIIPMYEENLRLIAYDKYGVRIDMVEITS